MSPSWSSYTHDWVTGWFRYIWTNVTAFINSVADARVLLAYGANISWRNTNGIYFIYVFGRWCSLLKCCLASCCLALVLYRLNVHTYQEQKKTFNLVRFFISLLCFHKLALWLFLVFVTSLPLCSSNHVLLFVFVFICAAFDRKISLYIWMNYCEEIIFFSTMMNSIENLLVQMALDVRSGTISPAWLHLPS